MTLPIILCSELWGYGWPTFESKLWCSWTEKPQMPHSWSKSNIVQKQRGCPAVQTGRFNTDLRYCCSYQSAAPRGGETRHSLKHDFCQFCVWVLYRGGHSSVKNKMVNFRNKANLKIASWQEIKLLQLRGGIKRPYSRSILATSQKGDLIFRQSLRAMRKPGLFGFIGSCKSAQIMYDLKGKRGPEHDPLPSAATT